MSCQRDSCNAFNTFQEELGQHEVRYPALISGKIKNKKTVDEILHCRISKLFPLFDSKSISEQKLRTEVMNFAGKTQK